MDRIAALICLGLTAIAPALAADTHMDHSDHMQMEPAQSAEGSPSSKAFEAVNQKMHAAMSKPYTGDADVDFVNGMIAHHQGAIDMAKAELQYGKDPEMRKLAEDIIKAQEPEIAAMNAWLAKHKK
ncbi:CopM family metallochaperone [Hyphomicrobium sp.]|uniref:CopM family metallochaperone n=1 Tax=Hyphomicrobium sp. TaxID=82 RepID=UPI002D789452|nr:DUF305 domain-containing protein [Hyphomicrobium sp.]HET6390948.1 DUF305 domain-containing protein [Hyphomicrobium sp.]